MVLAALFGLQDEFTSKFTSASESSSGQRKKNKFTTENSEEFSIPDGQTQESHTVLLNKSAR